MLERVNNQIFKVKFKKFFLFNVWVLISVKVGYDDTNSEVKCQSSYFNGYLSENGSIKAVLSENPMETTRTTQSGHFAFIS